MSKHEFVVFLHLKAERSWLSLSRADRNAIVEKNLIPLLTKYSNITHRHFDAEAFSVSASDVEMFTCKDPKEFYFFFEDFRDSVLIAEGYFTIVNILPTYEDGFIQFESLQATSHEV